MSGKQFLDTMIFFVWFMTTSIISAFAFVLGNYLPNPNPDYQLWIVAIVFCNLIGPTRWYHKTLRQQGGDD